ncbi:MAG: hypothetical protein C4567_16180 [Deltaproteobacteria bacterium]|nr:MAG: hypothetical protein C4567_16180 [Deltaproteobacteria bacterium]
MKILCLMLVAGLLAAGCATFHHTESIDTDQHGVIYGKYNSDSSGRTGSIFLSGVGAGWETAAASRLVSGNPASGALGGAAIYAETGPPKVSPVNFARSIAMINYSKKLKSIKYDEFGGIVEYQFDGQAQPTKKGSFHQTYGKSNVPRSFGHQPIE